MTIPWDWAAVTALTRSTDPETAAAAGRRLVSLSEMANPRALAHALPVADALPVAGDVGPTTVESTGTGAQVTVAMLIAGVDDLAHTAIDAVPDAFPLVLVHPPQIGPDLRAVVPDRRADLIPMPWADDFGHARNIATSAAETAWVLHVDADEILLPGAPDVVARAARELETHRDRDVIGVSVVVHDASTGDRTRIGRMYRARGHLRFAGAVHEHLVNATDRSGPMRYVDLDAGLVHHGYDGSNSIEKAMRNTAILDSLVDREPSNPLWWYFRGRDGAAIRTQADTDHDLAVAASGGDRHHGFLGSPRRAARTRLSGSLALRGLDDELAMTRHAWDRSSVFGVDRSMVDDAVRAATLRRWIIAERKALATQIRSGGEHPDPRLFDALAVVSLLLGDDRIARAVMSGGGGDGHPQLAGLVESVGRIAQLECGEDPT